MSQNELTYAEQMRADGKFPAVLRFASMSSADAAGMIMHGERRGGNLDHIDASRTHLNRTIIGSDQIATELVAETREMAEFNLRSNLLGLNRLGRRKDAAIARRRGLQDPWNGSNAKSLPHREVLLTVHRDHFRADVDAPPEHVLEFLDDEGLIARFDKRKVERFVDAGTEFLTEEFGGQLRYLRIDFDEQSTHFQGLLTHRVKEKASGRFAYGRHLYQITKHRCIGNEYDGEGRVTRRGYEVAQDVVGKFFDRQEHREMGIVRGEARAKKAREVTAKINDEKEGVEVDAFVGVGEEIPLGSPRAQRMWILRKLAAEKVAEKGGAAKVRQSDKLPVVLEMLELAGAVTPDERHQAQTRRAQKELIARHEQQFGNADEILENPEIVSAALVRIEAEKRAADEARAKADEAAAVERARLDREAEKRRRETAAELAKREEKVASREVEIERKIGWMNATLKRLQGLGDAIEDAARRLGILDMPWIKKALTASGRVREISQEQSGNHPEL